MTGDPAPGMGFLVDLDISGVKIGRFAECTGLSLEYDVLDYAEGGQNGYSHKLRGRIKYPNLVLKRGVTDEAGLLKWFFKVQERKQCPPVTITLVSADGKAIRKWSFQEAIPIKWTGPTLNAGSNDVATETLEIAHSGFQLPVE